MADRSRRQPPRLDRLPPAGLPAAGAPDVAGDRASWEEVRVAGALPDIPGARQYRFEQCELRGVALPPGCRELRLIDCVVGGLDLANVTLASFDVTGTSFAGCRFLGATLAGSVDRAVLTDCQLSMATLRMCRVADTDFDDCTMREIDLYGTELRSVLFRGCDLTGATLSKASLGGCEIRDCRLDEIRGVEALSGVRIAYADLVGLVPQMAHALGIEVGSGATET